MKFKLKAKDYNVDEVKRKITSKIKETEDEFPNFELVHSYGDDKNTLRIYNLEEEKYINPQDALDFVNKLNSNLDELGLYAFRNIENLEINKKGTREDYKVPTKEVTKQQPTQPNRNDNNEEERRWTPSARSLEKLETLRERYGRFFREDSLELTWKERKRLWGPKFSYNYDDGDIPTAEQKEEIANYIEELFY